MTFRAMSQLHMAIHMVELRYGPAAQHGGWIAIMQLLSRATAQQNSACRLWF